MSTRRLPLIPLTARLFVLAALMGATAVAAATATRTEAVPSRESLAGFPLEVDGWHGREQPALPADVLAELGADEYLDRSYTNGAAAVGLYVGYYASQRQGDSVHSPLNCLPGTGWVPIESGYLDVPRGGGGGDGLVTVRRLRVRRGSDDALVLYWYHSRGRVIANDYLSKAYLMYDAIRLNRTDTALVRIFSMVDERAGGVVRAEDALVSFLGPVVPLLDRYLPE